MEYRNVTVATRGECSELEILFRLDDIQWDTDDEDIDGLPSMLTVWASDTDHAIDQASDAVGWCINGSLIDLAGDVTKADIENAIG